MRKTMVASVVVLGTLVMPVPAWAASVSPTTGQPGAPTNTCGSDFPTTPGNAVNAKGSAFNPSGTAGTVYAGNDGTSSLKHANSTAAVSQYDTACVRLSP